jgi:hypothetical protein
MTLVAMQPTYLPWAGYFNLMARTERFVFLNNVQFDKPSWQMRNRILVGGQPHFLTVPTQGSQNQLIMDVAVDGAHWREKHSKLLEHTYGKHAFGRAMLDCVQPILCDASTDKLEALNMRLIEALSRNLELTPEFHRASSLPAEGKRSARLVSLCRHFGDEKYLSPAGSAEYIAEDRAFDQAGILVEFQRFQPKKYAQRKAPEFVPSLSIVDVVANLGWAGAAEYVRAA